MRKAAGNLLLLTLGILLPLLALEASLRAGLLDMFSQETKRLNPSGILRRAKGEDEIRIVVLGDSFSAGRKDYPYFLEKELARPEFESRFRFLNLSIAGTGPTVYYKRLTTIGAKFQPDLVMVGVCIGNDIGNVRNPYSQASLKNDIYYFFKRNSYLAVFCKRKLDMVRRRYGRAGGSPSPGEVPAPGPKPGGDPKREYLSLTNRYLIAEARKHPGFFQDTLFLSHEGMRRSFADMLVILGEIAARSRALGAEVLFVLIPHSTQVHEDFHPYFRDMGFTISPGFLTERVVQDRLSAYFEENGLPYLDLLPAFREHAGEYYFFLDDGHWNTRGMKFAARRIFEFLVSRDVVQPERTPRPPSVAR